MTLPRFLDPAYYLDPAPFGQPFAMGRPLAALFLAILIVSFLLLIRTELPRLKHRARVRSTAYWLLFFGLAGGVLLYFRRDHVPFLGMRLWITLLLAALVIWAVARTVPALRSEKR
jgi:uncharacterized membrane protein YdcZ (DUF606 family)